MNDKELLQEIKRKVMTFDQELREIDLEEHIDWLIEQAEKIQRCQESYSGLNKMYDHWRNKAKELEQQLQQTQAKVERYEKALGEIANEQEVGEGDFNAADVANKLIAIAKEVLELEGEE